jgi:hypothetical protein
MSEWRNCVVTFIDVVGIKKLALAGDSGASSLMRQLHHLTVSWIGEKLPKHAQAYCWNDSVLLLGYLENATPGELLREAQVLKSEIEATIGRCYGICVRGQTFPELPGSPPVDKQVTEQPRAVVIKASSFALANCFQIEAALGKKHRAAWYVDERLRTALPTPPWRTERVSLLPTGEAREILMFNGPFLPSRRD